MSRTKEGRNLRRYVGKKVADVIKAVEKNGGTLEMGAKHRILVMPNGTRIAVPGTPRDRHKAELFFIRQVEKAGEI